MAQFLSQQFNSLLGAWIPQTNNTPTNHAKKTKFRAKVLDLYDEIFIQHKQITTLGINFLHLNVHRHGLYEAVRAAINNQQHDPHHTTLLFNKVFQYCINSLLDEKLLVVQHAFQTISIMLISIAKCDRYLSVSDILTYICEYEQFDKYFEIIDERISNTILSLKDINCKIAALEFTLSIMMISGNIHSNLFTEHLLINSFHKMMFKYLKYDIKQMHEQYQNINNEDINSSELIIDNDDKNDKQSDDTTDEENKENEDDAIQEEDYIINTLKDKQRLSMLVLSNIMVLSHYQRFESDNIALKYISNMKVQPTAHINYIIVSLTQHTIKAYKDLFPETRMHQIGNYVQSISGFFTSASALITTSNASPSSPSSTASSTASTTTISSPQAKKLHDLNSNTHVISGLLDNITYCTSMILLSVYALSTFNNPGWMVHSAGVRKSTPDEITKHPRVVVSPHICPSILKHVISLTSCVFQYYFYQTQLFDESNEYKTKKIEKIIESHEQLTRLSLIIYSRLTEIPACLIVLFSTDFKRDPLLQYAHKERNSIVWKEIQQQPVIGILFDIWCDYIQNIGRRITQYHEQHEMQAESKENEDEISGGLNSGQLFNPLLSSHTLFSLRILLDIFLRCMIFQNQMELFFSKSVFYLRLMKILMNLMRLFVKYYEDHYSELLFDIICRIVVIIRMMIGCCENIFDAKESHMISFFLELSRYRHTFNEFNDIIHNEQKHKHQNRRDDDKLSERLKKDSRVVVRVSKFFEDAITLEFPEWKSTNNPQTPLHHSRALKLVRETLKCDEFEIPPPKLNGQYLGYQETNKKEIKFFNHIIKQNIVRVLTKMSIS